MSEQRERLKQRWLEGRQAKRDRPRRRVCSVHPWSLNYQGEPCHECETESAELELDVERYCRICNQPSATLYHGACADCFEEFRNVI